MDIHFHIKNQIMHRTDNLVVVNKSKNVLFANFTFEGEDWDGKRKFAIFKNERRAFTSSLGIDNEGRCGVPPDALTGRYLKISVYGGDLMTSNELTIILVPTGYTTKISPSSSNINKDVFVDLYEKIEGKIDNVIYEGGYLKCRSGDKVIYETELFLDVKEMVKEEVRLNIPHFRLDDLGNLYVVYPE